MRTRVLRRPIVFLHVRFSICVRCTILILLLYIAQEVYVAGIEQYMDDVKY